ESIASCDEARSRRNPAQSAVCSDHERTTELSSTAQLDRCAALLLDHVVNVVVEELGACTECLCSQALVERAPGQDETRRRVNRTLGPGWGSGPPPRPDQKHVAARPTVGKPNAEIVEHLDRPRLHEVAAGLVPRKPGSIDQQHASPCTREAESSHGTRRPG